MVSPGHPWVAGAHQGAPQGSPPAAPDLRRVGPPLANAHSPDDGPCPARPPAGLWRHPKLQLLQHRHSSAGGRAGQGPLFGEHVFANDFRPWVDFDVPNADFAKNMAPADFAILDLDVWHR